MRLFLDVQREWLDRLAEAPSPEERQRILFEYGEACREYGKDERAEDLRNFRAALAIVSSDLDRMTGDLAAARAEIARLTVIVQNAKASDRPAA